MNHEIGRRRTFAIISHPDAGKTTLTEKFLLYGGAVQLAGSVTARKRQRETASDWMELEKKRGISISSTLLQFDYHDWKMNLLDTPGHKDFSEDTYRVLMAVDAVVMVIDSGKGIETQTRKLFEICRNRSIPIFTFMNKLDRPGKPPLELLDEIEQSLQIHAYPVNWPLGMGDDFKGVYDRLEKKVYLYERTVGGAYRAPETVHDLSDPLIKDKMDERTYQQVMEEIQILDEVHVGFDPASVLEGDTTPVFFGSAANNFGVQLLLDGFVKYAPPPAPRKAEGRVVPVDHKAFSGFIFKIQTNMDPMHRDRIAFMRVCSGKFTRDMEAVHTRTGKKVRLSGSHTLFGQNREIVDEAYAGDILGFIAKSDFLMGDTISEDASIVYREIPRFAPECFGYLNNPSPAKYKPFRKGMEHLLAENIVQSFTVQGAAQRQEPLLGAVGPLQFEVLQYRLKSEYGADSTLERMPWEVLRWVQTDRNPDEFSDILPYQSQWAVDDKGNPVFLFSAVWSMESFQTKYPDIVLLDSPPRPPAPKVS
ncbi:MAG TPA: peptide chain release factor 3 [Verrucomicrobiae bacterium]|nr:peptide chain release factor 3 [Verrucomicrobiae bacterium]